MKCLILQDLEIGCVLIVNLGNGVMENAVRVSMTNVRLGSVVEVNCFRNVCLERIDCFVHREHNRWTLYVMMVIFEIFLWFTLN